ncbi:Arginyl-tRNA synthetase [Entomortierella beljakovae]|nr:Arginyl-tRNA synthetase [Entomortierella beljakovae]
MQDSVLVIFRRIIASHILSVLGEPFSEEGIFPIVQQNTGGHRKATHSVFSVVIRRLTTTIPVAGFKLQDDLIEKCLSLSPETQKYIERVRRIKDMLLFDPVPLQLIQLTIQHVYQHMESDGGRSKEAITEESKSNPPAVTLTGGGGKRKRDTERLVMINGAKIQSEENGYSCLRRTVLTGFTARFLKNNMSGGHYHGSIKVVTELPCSTIDPKIKELYRDLDLVTDPLVSGSSSNMESYIRIIKSVIKVKKRIQVQVDEQGAWIVDLTSSQLGKPKLFSKSKSDESEVEVMEEPTLVIKTLVSLAMQFSEYDNIDRYIWMVPDSRRQFAEQVLHLAKVFFHGDGDGEGESEGEGDESTGSETTANRIGRKRVTSSWVKSVEPFYFGVATGVDIWKSQSNLDNGITGIVEYTNAKMREIIVENRGRPGRGTEYGGDGIDDDDDEDVQVLDEGELTRMTKILSTSALAFASVGGKRIRKLNIDMSRIMDGKGNSGVFLQIERKSKVKFNLSADLTPVQGYSEALNLSLVIAEWSDILSNLEETLDPYILVSHLFRLAGEIGQANRVLRVKDMEANIAESRWLLFWAAKQVLEQGLWLLGLELVDRM